MSEAKEGAERLPGELSHEQRMTALFSALVVNQTQLALMLLGKTPHPSTGQTVMDLEGARMFIDQLEMLEEKTKGNLDQNERRLLRDQLTALRLAFVEATTKPTISPRSAPDAEAAAAPGETGRGPAGGTDREAAGPMPASEPDSRKKFSKKY